MALNAYLRLKGETQGDIKGSVFQRGRTDSIMVIAANHEVLSPRDAASGLPTGKRQHRPLVITKEIDKATPLLMNALVNHENISEFRLEFWQPSKSGTEVQFYTIELHNASIADIRFEMLNNRYPENMQHKEREHISFCYQKIVWTYEDGGISSEDDWEAPNV
jgi:type VI secretion system secreted protein Hcp